MVATELVSQLRARYGIQFKDLSLLDTAFTHSSYANEHKELGVHHYERLEFLGDAVLEIAVSDFLFRHFQHLPEGELTRLRSAIVRTEGFSTLADEAGFRPYIRLGIGEERSGARQRAALLEDVFEAFNGALYLDQGMPAVVAFLEQIMFPKILEGHYSAQTDYKTRLQEYVQQKGDRDIEYRVITENDDHAETSFQVELYIDGQRIASGQGRNKKQAEKAAAKAALENHYKLD